jgi:hypothetical protein
MFTFNIFFRREGYLSLLNEKYLSELLLDKGVDGNHLIEMKSLENRSRYPMELYYDTEEEKTYETVPVSKIKGLGFRGTPGISWFDHACCEGTDNIDVGRCEIAIERLQRISLEEYHVFYQNHPVRLIHYKEDDSYFVNGDGTHRTLFAKVTGCETVRAKVNHATINSERYGAYKRFEQLLHQFKALLKKHDLEEELLSGSDRCTSFFYKGKFVITYDIYSPSYFKSKYQLNHQAVDKWEKDLAILESDLKIIKRHHKHFHRLFSIFPSSLRNKFFSLIAGWVSIVDSHDEKRQKYYELRKAGLELYNIDTGSREVIV